MTVLGMRTPITSSPATTVLTRSRTAITRSGSKRCERDVMCIPVKLQQLLCSIFHFFFFLHFYRHKFCFINRNAGFFSGKVTLGKHSFVSYNRKIARPFPSSRLTRRKRSRDVTNVFGRMKDVD